MKTPNYDLIDKIGRDNAIIDGFTIHSNPTIARDNFRKAMEEYAQERTKDMYPKEFVEWIGFEKGERLYYREISDTWFYSSLYTVAHKEYTLDELFQYWQNEIKGK